jgi:hypothetical protein
MVCQSGAFNGVKIDLLAIDGGEVCVAVQPPPHPIDPDPEPGPEPGPSHCQMRYFSQNSLRPTKLFPVYRGGWVALPTVCNLIREGRIHPRSSYWITYQGVQ